VIFLVSGGGSAMLEWPVSNEITLEDLQQVNRQLVTSGASIAEINAIRRSLSAVKGGALARRAPDAQIVTLIVSDTNLGDEASVASGPTLPTPAGAPDVTALIEKYGLTSTLPSSVLNAIRKQTTDSSTQSEVPSPFNVLLDNTMATEVARQKAVELGFTTTVEDDIVEQSIDEGTELLLKRINNRAEAPFCSISGGEFGCRVEGNGRGGRNLETVLRCAIKLERESTSHTVVLSAGTDGIDGSSDAAGAIADENTMVRARAAGLDAAQYLRTSDSHGFFEALGDLIVTGPTGTNVRDLRVALRA
jgi:glycerate-2-kinase